MAAMLMMMVMVVAALSGVTHASPAPPPASPASSSSSSSVASSHRDEKFLNLQFLPFVTLRVQPEECRTNSDNSSGTCASAADCRRQGGRADGSCSNGYGVCCVYQLTCGGTVKTNNSYLVNNDYPNSFMDIDNCQYTIQKVNNKVCQLRLDFEKMELAGPDNMTTCSEDTFTFVGTAGANPTVICGQNTGQHMYLDLGAGNADARINIATTSTNSSRSWKIKVTQIACSSVNRAPPNCLQYFTDYSGSIQSFNYQNNAGIHQLAGQRYTICVRTREGFCGIKYMADHFSVSKDAESPSEQTGDTQCKEDFVLVPSMDKDGAVTLPDRYCGSELKDLITYSKPFELRVVTDEVEATDDKLNRGFALRYTQIPC